MAWWVDRILSFRSIHYTDTIANSLTAAIRVIERFNGYETIDC